MRHITLLSILGLAFVLPVPSAFGAPPAEPRFSETTSVVAVEVPVQVSVDGQPVRGLTVDNFEVYDGRQKQVISGFEVIDLSNPPAQVVAAAPVAGRRHFLLLFDLLNSEPASLAKAREAVLKMVANLPPADLVAVATYSRSHAARLLLGFTSDRRQVEIAVERMEAPQLYDRNPDPLSLIVQDLEAEPSAAGAGGGGYGADAKAAVIENAREDARLSQRSTRQQQTGDVAALTGSFAELARMLSSVRGRKYVVYLSEGFDSSLLVGQEKEDADTRQAREFGETWNVDSEQTFGSTKVQGDLERMVEEFRKSDCIIQSVDIGRLRADADQRPRASGTEVLVAMAKDTGGELYRNYNDLGAAMGQMLNRTAVTYLLAFQPSDLKPDGKYRRISVKLKSAPKGAEVVYRPGYYAPRPFGQQSALERRLQAADLIVGGRDAGMIQASALAAPFRTGGGKAYVPVIVEVDGKSLLAGQTQDVLPAEVYAYAIDERGEVKGFFVQSLGLDLKKVRATLEQSGFKFFGHLDLAPGRYSIRVMVRNGQTGASAMRVLPVEVAAEQEAGPIVLAPFFPETAGRWLMVREPPKQGQSPAPYPFIGKQDAFIPAASPRITVQTEAPVCVMAYNLGDAPLAVDGHLEGADGKPVAGGKLRITERIKAASGADRLLGTLRADNVPPGHYTLRVKVKSGGREFDAPAVGVEVAAAGAGT